MPVFRFYKYKLLLQYGDLEKYIHIISDNKHIIQTKIKKQKATKTKKRLSFAHNSFLVYDIKALRILSLKCPLKWEDHVTDPQEKCYEATSM